MITRLLVLFALVALQIVTHPAYGDDLPTELFGLHLGMTTIRTAESPSGELPVKQLTGIRPWNRGARYYFEPATSFEDFPFLDYREGTESSYGTNFYSIVFPVIPEQVTTVSEWESYAKENGEEFQVLTIEYTSEDFDSEREAYLAVSEMCTGKRVDLFREPVREVDTVEAEKNSYRRTCIFAQDDRELEISQFGSRYVYRLKYSDEYILAVNEAVEQRIEAMHRNAGELSDGAEGSDTEGSDTDAEGSDTDAEGSDANANAVDANQPASETAEPVS